jgi:hypothetical protein
VTLYNICDWPPCIFITEEVGWNLYYHIFPNMNLMSLGR